MAPLSDNSLFPTGLSIDPNTGVLSGTANYGGTAGFMATVKDSSSHIAQKPFTITAYSPLTAGAPQSFSATEYSGVYLQFFGQGGFLPLIYSIGGGSFPPGLHLNPSTGLVTGAPTAIGNFQFSIRITDSYSPPEIADQPVSVTVSAASLQAVVNFPSRALLNRPVSGQVIASGGTPPYTFQLNNPPFPAGFGSLDPSAGTFSGTPTAAGSYAFTVNVKDSSTPTPQMIQPYFSFVVGAPLGRNDSPATATHLGNGSFMASISPFSDSPGAPTPDTDYYSLIASAGSTVHVETFAKRNYSNDPLDTVIELTDPNGVQLAAGCNQPGGTTNFSSACLDDDISASPHVQDSALDYKVPGATGTQTFLIHVLDWSGNARPDMLYTLQVSGAIDPLSMGFWATPPAGLMNQSYGPFNFPISGGYGVITWSVASGNLPPGLSLSAAGVLSGTPTTVGTSSFTVSASDSSTPPQVLKTSYSITIEAGPQITSTSFPDAKVGVAYNQPVSHSGTSQPTYWQLASSIGSGCCINLTYNTGVLTGTPTVAGTFTFTISYQDQLGFYAPSKQFTINIAP
jgi:hypothetical protein